MIGKGHKGGFATLAERKSRLYLALPIANKTAQAANDAITKLLTPLKHWVKTLTFDNGREFSGYDALAENLDCNTYFAKPYHSWERGLNENHNGLLRQLFPKQMALDSMRDLCINMNNHQSTTFHQLGYFIKTCRSLAGTSFNKIPNLAKSVILLIIPIYAKVSMSKKEAFRVTDLMNNRPRKCLGYKTPFEVFAKMTGKDYFLNGSVALMG